jgi:hypothetical protein
MNNTGKIALFILMNLMFAFTDSFAALRDVIDAKVLETINHAEEISGLKSEEFSILKPEIVKTWTSLLANGVVEISGTDKDVRPCFVALQAILEHIFTLELQKNVKDAVGVIHTPMPATPLCTKGEISAELVDPAIEIDPLRLFTVKARTTILRDFLFKGGKIAVVYPKNGYSKRTEEQQKIYQQELVNYRDKLFDMPLNCETIDKDIIGATYLFQDNSELTWVFAIQMTQANDPQEIGHFGLWFGPISHPAVQARLKTVSRFVDILGIFDRGTSPCASACACTFARLDFVKRKN